MARPHESLQTWKEAMRLVRTVYDLTKTFPREETYGLTAQMRRAAVFDLTEHVAKLLAGLHRKAIVRKDAKE
jgi:hypothetical protein